MNVTKITMIALAAVTLSCTISMMYVFMSGDAGGSDVRALITLQTIAVPIALIIFFAELINRSRKTGLGKAFAGIWNSTPASVVVAVLLINLLVVIGELALLLRVRLSGEPALWFEHAPLVCALSCSLAFCALYARANPNDSRGVTRW